jgi:hypothetical protein
LQGLAIELLNQLFVLGKSTSDKIFFEITPPMNNLLAYHLVTLIPMMAILYLYIYGVIGAGLFAILFCLYAFVYRPIIDYKKLKEKMLVSKKEFIKSLGFIRFNYLSGLLFEK